MAAIGPGPDPAAAGGWKLYFHTEDVDATTKAVEQAGGSVLVPPGDVGPMGRMAVLADPAGARFALVGADVTLLARGSEGLARQYADLLDQPSPKTSI